MLWNLAVFGLVGLFVGAAARLFYPDRQFLGILVTLLQAVAGALLGGLLSWNFWPEVDNQFATGALLASALGAVAVIVFSTSLAYVRRIAAPKNLG
jgi:uncharacterized membrane protein YeaQ/YmgE (transglycosylase-associated protein family)